ncbi:hypothetical protein LIER_28521 [Lithospermum erythrorhizon]|uniref:Uncharacterized protein n=1 Tax=Lithospermum erythrorhizon TaxID=34254 RepID=A0AAV3RHV7_LITER
MGRYYDLEIVNTDFHGKVFMIMLHRNFSKQHEGQRKLLLVDYYDDTNCETDCQSSSQSLSFQLHEHIADPTEKGNLMDVSSSPLSPLKRQIYINPDTSAKKKLLMEKNDDGEGSNNFES